MRQKTITDYFFDDLKLAAAVPASEDCLAGPELEPLVPCHDKVFA